MIHNAPNTSSTIVSKSIAKDGGAVDYRGTFVLVVIVQAHLATSNVTRSSWMISRLLIQSLTMKF